MLVYELSPADRAASLAGIQAMMSDNALQHAVGARWKLADIVAAHEAVESGTAIGNVVWRSTE